MLTNLHNAIVAQLLLDVPGLNTCEAYPDMDTRINLPAVLIETDDSIESAKDEGTEQLCLTTRWRAYCVYDPNLPNANLEVRNLAVTVALAIYLAGRFGQPVDPAKIISIHEDDFKQELDGYLVWAVEWEHDLCVGTSAWDAAGVTPTEINIAYAPDTGSGGTYEKVL